MKKTVVCIILTVCIVIGAALAGFMIIREPNETPIDPVKYALNVNIPAYTENGLLLELSEDGSFYTVVGIGYCCDEHIEIPEKHNNKPIKAINTGVFFEHKELKTLSLPDTLTYVGTSFPESLEYNVIGDLRYLGNKNNPYLVLVDSQDNDIESVKIHKDTRLICGSAFREHLQLKKVTLPKNLKVIGASAFAQCYSLTSINLPDSLTEIGGYAFVQCVSLKSISLPSSLEVLGTSAFSNCTSLTHIKIPASVKELPRDLFSACVSLTEVELEKGIEYISSCTFENCSALKSITIPRSVKTISSLAFKNCSALEEIILPDSVEVINADSFSGVPNSCFNEHLGFHYLGNKNNPYLYLIKPTEMSHSSEVELHPDTKAIARGSITVSICTSLSIPKTSKYLYSENNCLIRKSDRTLILGLAVEAIPDGVKKIGDYAFKNCPSLKSVSIPDSVEIIGEHSFQKCLNLVSVNLGANVTEIGAFAFFGCKQLNDVKFGVKTEQIGESAFLDCDSLTTIILPESLKSLGARVFGFSGLTEISVPASVKVIPQYAFDECLDLAKVSIHGATVISERAFVSCHKLSEVSLPDSLLVIEEAAFSNCWVLSVCNIPKSLLCIGDSAFYYCATLESINLPQTLIYLGKSVFTGSKITSAVIFDGITGISARSFARCTSLNEITLPATVKEIGDYAFIYCESLTTVNFNGTRAEWDAVVKGINWRAKSSAFTVKCTDGDIEYPADTSDFVDPESFA